MQGYSQLIRHSIELAFWNLVIKVLTALKPWRRIVRLAYQFIQSHKWFVLSTKIAFISIGIFILTLIPTTYILYRNNGENTKGIVPSNEKEVESVVIFHVSESDQSQLGQISTWNMVLDKTNPALFTFIPLYLENITPEINDLSEALLLSSEGVPSPVIIEVLKQNIPHYRGYIVIDDLAATTIYYSITETVPKSVPNPDSRVSIIVHESILINEVCSQLMKTSSDKSFLQLWDTLVPIHMRTDLEFSAIFDHWNTIVSSRRGTLCEAVISE